MGKGWGPVVRARWGKGGGLLGQAEERGGEGASWVELVEWKGNLIILDQNDSGFKSIKTK